MLMFLQFKKMNLRLKIKTVLENLIWMGVTVEKAFNYEELRLAHRERTKN